MFGKKPPQTPPAQPKTASAPSPRPAAAPAGWLVQALTTDYASEGYMAPVEMPLIGHLNMTTQATLTLSPAKLTPLEPQALIADATPPEVSIVKSTLIALIPVDEAGMASARSQMPGRTVQAMLYAGPYVIRAALAMMGDMPLRHLFNTGVGNMIAATDVEIRCQILGTPFAPLVAPIALLNKSLIQLYHPAGQ
jgi:hypothetical protein